MAWITWPHCKDVAHAARWRGAQGGDWEEACQGEASPTGEAEDSEPDGDGGQGAKMVAALLRRFRESVRARAGFDIR